MSLTNSLVDDWISHRICVARVGGVIAGGLIRFSVYLKHGEQGAGPINRVVLDHLEHQLEMCRGPWCLGGDFNMTPSELLATGFPGRVKGVIFAPSVATCNDNTYDYFVVSERIEHAVQACVRVDETGISPHSPSRLLIRPNCRYHMSRECVRPPEVPASLADGPRATGTDMSRLCQPCAANQIAIDRAAALWDDNALEQWKFVQPDKQDVSKPMRAASGPYFEWSYTVGPKASATVGHSKEAHAWAVAANRANLLASLVGKDPLVAPPS